MTIRVAWTADGHIEAAIYSLSPAINNLIIDSRTGNVVGGSVRYGDDLFRPLVRAARDGAFLSP